MPKRAALADAIESYLLDLSLRVTAKTAKESRSALERIQRETGWISLDDVTRESLDRWRRARMEAGSANRTVNRQVGEMLATLALAVDAGLIARSPLDAVRALPTKGKHRHRVSRSLPDSEMARLLRAAESLDAEKPERFPRAPLLATLADTGARWHELVLTTWADLDLDRALLLLRAETTKTAEPRAVPLKPETLERILGLRAHHSRVLGKFPTGGSRIFLAPKGGAWGRDTNRIGLFLSECLLRAGLPKRDSAGRVFTIHAFRRSFISRAARHGVPVHLTARITGIRTLQVLNDHYLDVAAEELAGAMRTIPPICS